MLPKYVALFLASCQAITIGQKFMEEGEEEGHKQCSKPSMESVGTHAYVPSDDGGWIGRACEGPSYIHPKTGRPLCCMLNQIWSADPVHFNEGKCCAAETSAYSFDSATGQGDCCLRGQTFVGTSCTELPRPISPLSSAPASAPTTNDCDGGSCPVHDPTRCPQAGTLGITYGRCYMVSDLNGNGMTRNADSGWRFYYLGNYYQTRNIVFRICHNNTLSSCNSIDDAVPDGGTWSMNDQTGFLDGQKSGDFVGSYDTKLHLTNTGEISYQVDFTAHMRCLHGKCAPCVRISTKTGSSPKNYLGLAPNPSNPYGDWISLYPNTNSCIPLNFEEVACLGPW